MIPKVIHYCWFGGSELPPLAKKCIRSWRAYFPDYEIKEWNESNYDVNKVPYTQQAYQQKKYAFVSDYARFDILYRYGGVYFDTDVEVIKSFDDILFAGSFMGCEIDGESTDTHPDNNYNNRFRIAVAPGLGMAASPGLNIYKEILDYYATQHFYTKDGTLDLETVVTRVTKVLASHGLRDISGCQNIDGITIYPKEYFNPLNNNTGELIRTVNTRSIHWYSMSWSKPSEKVKNKVTRVFHRLFGEDCFEWLNNKLNKDA